MYRMGPDYRFNDQVDFSDIKETFGFNTIKIGHWVTKEERLFAANLIYDAFADLSLILNVPSKLLGLRQTLNLAYGTGGQLGVQAHYAAHSRTLALAKNAGKGALAHEWWHAFDHYICKFLFKDAHAIHFASSRWLDDAISNTHPLNQYLDNLFRQLFLSADQRNISLYVNKATSLDRQQKQFYYAKPEELSARAFEHFIASHTEIINPFLVNDVFGSCLEKQGGFPDRALAKRIEPLYLKYFNDLGCLLQRSL
ncbi:CLCA_X family protein [Pseudoalteromonas xiamenensis]|uniref:Large polyvalent protein-associated domain-containing protein n=1 Tax=Pseudoalteromonas xiamenensis TaxID=882626 RepID=A0A975HN25_9GAMM|nr:CLCA_X family protein [Pseudoalteromonas xiamenensis]QTH71770.1 hypothetical protein J5O05_02105 [Pseudoalteromonas xiamenensis]